MSQKVIIERFFEVLTSGDRNGARQIVDECIDSGAEAEAIIERLFWPTLELIHKMFRNDQMSVLSHNYATRLLRMLCDQMQLRLERQEPKDKVVLLLCGPQEREEIGGQLAADLLEAAGYEVHFAGGGVANDEVINQIGQVEPVALVIFSTAPADLPHIRKLIDELSDAGKRPGLQVVVGGGVFNRAEGLAEEIGSDLWAQTPCELVAVMESEPDRRATTEQRTVGRRRRASRSAAA